MEIFNLKTEENLVNVLQPFKNDIWVWVKEGDNPLRTKIVIPKENTKEKSVKEDLAKFLNNDTVDRILELIRVYLDENFSYTVPLFSQFRFVCSDCNGYLNIMVDTSSLGLVKVNQRGNSTDESTVFYGNIHGFVSEGDSVFSFECDECNKTIGAELWNTLVYTDGTEEILFKDTSMINKLFVKGILTHAVVEDEYTGEYEKSESITREAALNLLKMAFPSASKEDLDGFLNELYDECKTEDIQNGCYH